MQESLQRWRFAFRNLIRHSRRNLISGLAIACGFAGLALMAAYVVRTDFYARTVTVYLNHVGHLSIYKKDGLKKLLINPAKYTLSPQDVQKLESVANALPEVQFTARFLVGQGLLSTGCNETPFIAVGIDDARSAQIRNHAEVSKWTPKLISGALEKSISNFPQVPDGISITNQIAEMLNKPKVWDDAPDVVSPLVAQCMDRTARRGLASSSDVQLVAKSLAGDFSAVDAFIVAHHSTGVAFTEETSVQTKLSLLQKLFQTDDISYFTVYADPDINANDFRRRFVAKLGPLAGDYDVYSYNQEAVAPFYSGIMDFLTTMAGYFFILVMITVAITVVSFLTVGFLERKREMGTLRSIGYTPQKIAGDFFREATLLVFFSIIGGVGMSAMVTYLVNGAGLEFNPPGIAGTMPFRLVLTPRVCFLVASILGATGILSAWIKLKKVTQEPIVDLLRG